MGLFNSLFGGKKDISHCIIECRENILKAYGIGSPTDAQLFNATMGIAIASVGMLNEIGGGRLSDLIDKVTDEASSLVANLSFRIEEITNNEEEIDFIISEFPPFAEATKKLRTNGGAVFPILFNSKGPALVREIAEHSGGPMGSAGYAAIIVGDLTVGRDDAKDGFMLVSAALMQFLKEIASK